MTLILQPDHIQQMTRQAETTYPEECCGLLLGHYVSAEETVKVYELFAVANEWTLAVSPFAEDDPHDRAASSRGNRYWVDPKVLLKAQRYSRDRDWEIVGVYHSHPDHPAVPSERDRQLAWSTYSYPILSVTAGQVANIASWRLDDRGEFVTETLMTHGAV